MGRKSVGHYQVANLAAAKTLAVAIATTVPATADHCEIQAATQAVRYRKDGTDPTATVGLLLPVATVITVKRGEFTNFKMIEVAATAVVDIEFFKTG